MVIRFAKKLASLIAPKTSPYVPLSTLLGGIGRLLIPALLNPLVCIEDGKWLRGH